MNCSSLLTIFCLTQGRLTHRFQVNKAIQYTSNGYKDKLDLQISYVDEVFLAKWPRYELIGPYIHP